MKKLGCKEVESERETEYCDGERSSEVAKKS